MNIFEKLPDNFFSILSSRNKNIYGIALVVLYDALTMYRSRIRKNDYIDLLKSRSDEVVELSFEEDDEFDMASIEPTLSNKASYIVKRLIETGWIYIDYDIKTGAEYILLPSYSINMLKIIYQFADDSSSHYVSYVHTTYSDLKMEDDLQDDAMYNVLVNAYNNTLNLEIEVAKLDHSIKVFNRQLSEIFEPNEVLKQHFDICREDVVNPIYHPLKTHDSITLYHGPITNILNRWLNVESVRMKLAQLCLKENKSIKNINAAEEEIIKMINKIQDIYARLSLEIDAIDKTQSDYIKASTDKVIFLNNQDKSIKGKLEKIMSVLSRNINGGEEANKNYPNIIKRVVSSIKLYQPGYIDNESITKPYNRKTRFNGEPMPIDDLDYNFDPEAINVLIGATQKYSDESVMEFMSKNFKDKDKITAEDVRLSDIDDFVMLILASIKATSRVSFYDLERSEEMNINIDNGNYSVPNFGYVKKEE